MQQEVRNTITWSILVLLMTAIYGIGVQSALGQDLDIEKYVSVDGKETWQDADSAPGPKVAVGDTVYFMLVVTNNTESAQIVTVEDGDLGYGPTDIELEPGESKEITDDINLSVIAAEGEYTNTAYIVGDPDPLDQDDANYTGVRLLLRKYVSVDGGDTWENADDAPYPEAIVGSTVYYKLVVTNGTDSAQTVTVADADLGYGPTDTELEPGASEEITAGLSTTAAEGEQTNTAEAYIEVEVGEPELQDEDSATYLGFQPEDYFRITVDKVKVEFSNDDDGDEYEIEGTFWDGDGIDLDTEQFDFWIDGHQLTIGSGSFEASGRRRSRLSTRSKSSSDDEEFEYEDSNTEVSIELKGEHDGVFEFRFEIEESNLVGLEDEVDTQLPVDIMLQIGADSDAVECYDCEFEFEGDDDDDDDNDDNDDSDDDDDDNDDNNDDNNDDDNDDNDNNDDSHIGGTHGYWKHHTDEWVGYYQEDLLGDVFNFPEDSVGPGFPDVISAFTFLDADGDDDDDDDNNDNNDDNDDNNDGDDDDDDDNDNNDDNDDNNDSDDDDDNDDNDDDALSALAEDTLLEALDYDGGPGLAGAAKILLRSAVAALLNAAHPEVEYPPRDIIAEVNGALASRDRKTILNLAWEYDSLNNLVGE